MKPTLFVRKGSLKAMKIYKKKNRAHVFWPYLRDENEMEDLKDPRTLRDKQIFSRVVARVEGNVAPFM